MFINSQNQLYFGDCAQGDRAATAEEIAAWELSRIPAPPTPLEQIIALEREQLLPRATREFMLLSMEAQFPPEALALNYGYQAVKAFDTVIVGLRAQIP